MMACTQVASKSAQSVSVGMDTTFTDTVKMGDNAWGLSEKNFGTGVEWRQLIEMNPFLQEPGRVWYDHNKKMWFCMIHPGEVLKRPAKVLPILNPVDTSGNNSSIVLKPKEFNWFDKLSFWELLFVFVVIPFLLIIWLWSVLKRIRERKILKMNPVTAGEPQVKGGVNDGGARDRIQTLAQSQFPSARIEIKNIRRGKLSGVAKVHYDENTYHGYWDKIAAEFYGESLNTKKIHLNDVDGYAGEITVNGAEQTIFFLQGCGNDVQGAYMTGLTFTPNVVINEDGSSTPVVESQKEVVADELKDQKSETVSVTGSERHQQIMKSLSIVEKHIENDKEKHKITLSLENGNFVFSVDYRTFPEKKKQEEQKKS